MDEDTFIASLKADVDRLSAELVAAKIRLHEAQVAACGIALGDVVVSTGRRSKGARFRVVGIDPGWHRKPWLSGNPQRKDGSFGIAVRNLFDDWERA